MDSTETSRYVRKVLIGDIVQSYSMTLVGAGKSACGTTLLNAFVYVRSLTN